MTTSPKPPSCCFPRCREGDLQPISLRLTNPLGRDGFDWSLADQERQQHQQFVCATHRAMMVPSRQETYSISGRVRKPYDLSDIAFPAIEDDVE